MNWDEAVAEKICKIILQHTGMVYTNDIAMIKDLVRLVREEAEHAARAGRCHLDL